MVLHLLLADAGRPPGFTMPTDRAEAVSVGMVGTRGCQSDLDGSFGQRKEMETIACFKGIPGFCM